MFVADPTRRRCRTLRARPDQRTPRSLFDDAVSRRARHSRQQSWIAYISDSQPVEVYHVRPYPGRAKWAVSNGGRQAGVGCDGRELFTVSGRVMAVDVRSNDVLDREGSQTFRRTVTQQRAVGELRLLTRRPAAADGPPRASAGAGITHQRGAELARRSRREIPGEVSGATADPDSSPRQRGSPGRICTCAPQLRSPPRGEALASLFWRDHDLVVQMSGCREPDRHTISVL